MSTTRPQHVFARLLALGAQPNESSNSRNGRQVLVVGGLLMSAGALLWGSLAFAYEQWTAAMVPFGYIGLTAFNFTAFGHSRRFAVARTIQVAASLLLPFFFQWALGGFVASGAVMLWAIVALVGSLSFASARTSIAWLIVYCVLTVISGAGDDWFNQMSTLHAPPQTVRLFFVINVSIISSVVFGLSLMLSMRQRDAIEALEVGEAKTRRLADQMRLAVTARESDIARLQEADRALRDLTANLERQVRERTAQLATALDIANAGAKAKSEFLATMSHEIRTPLNGILGTAELLSDSKLDADQRAQLSVIRHSGELLLSVLNDVLDFSKIEAGQLELERKQFDVCAEIELVAALHRPKANEKGVALEVVCHDVTAPVLEGDSHRLCQVLGNLLANAVKFTEAGQIRVTARTRNEGSATRLEVSVSDTGIGMAPEVVHRLFHAFSQADSSITRRYGGTGLGLAICARLVERMGGGIDVTSAQGVGTTFRFDVATKEVEAPVQRRPSQIIRPNAAGLRVLLAEDNLVNQAIGAKLLRRLGCDVVVASNGVEVLSRLEERTFDLVLMDMQMPELDGLEATRAIRRNPKFASLRVVALTANAFESDRQACLEAGMNAFITKPLRIDQLEAEVLATVRVAA